MATTIQKVLGVDTPSKAFKRGHAKYAPVLEHKDRRGKTTPPVQNTVERAIRMIKNPDQALASEKEIEKTIRKFKKFYQKQLLKKGQVPIEDQETKDIKDKMGVQEVKAPMDSGEVETPTPLVYDPEILDILKQDAPLVARTPEEGQEGFEAVYNLITSRQDPIGMVSEAESSNVLDTGKTVNIERDKSPMKIYVDTIDISDFAERASQHYMNLSDTALQARVSEHAQFKEQMFLWGDPDQGLSDGSPGDENAYDGLKPIAESQSNDVDKSGVDISGTDGLLRDIKGEITDLLQGPYSISKGDLEIWTSHTVFDHLENELEVKVRIDQGTGEVDYGFGGINIKGIPVVPSHQVDSQSYGGGSYAPGSEGDVFIVNTRSIRFRSLAPLSTVPLSKRGLAEETALFEYGSLIAKADGYFTKYLYDYSV